LLQSLVHAPELMNRAYQALFHAGPHPALLLRSPLPPAMDGFPCGPWAYTLGVAWSLSVEEYFYAFWAPVVLLFRKTSAITVSAILIVAGSITVQYLGFSGYTDYFNFPCKMNTVMAGALLALYMQWRRKRSGIRKTLDRWAVVLGAASFVLFLLVLLWNRPILGRELRDSPSFMVVGVPSISILFFLSIGWVIDRSGGDQHVLRLLRLRPLRQLGTVSYSLYLFHVPVYQAIQLCTGTCGSNRMVLQWTVSIASLIVSIFLALMSWKYIESPILKLKDRWAPAPGSARSFRLISEKHDTPTARDFR
jgi:peptidoglycan/LPS O-acetylase OafA/YrhL